MHRSIILLAASLLPLLAGCSGGDLETSSGNPSGAGGDDATTTTTTSGGPGTTTGAGGGSATTGSGSSSESTGSGSGGGGVVPSGEQRVVGYFAAWDVYARDYHVMNIPADKLTHINYAFANIADGKCVLGDAYADTDKAYPGDTWDPGAKRGSFHQLELMKAAHPGLKTLISVGGWTWSGHFSDAALTADSRAKFAASCVEFMTTWGFDGIDIDWEYPVGGGLPENTYRPEDKQNYTLLLKEIRAQLDAKGQADGHEYLLTIAAPAGANIYKNLELADVASTIDWANLMAYDFHGGWDPITNFNAPLYAASTDPTQDPVVQKQFNVDAAVKGYMNGGFPANKLVVGVPFYGRGFKGVSSKDQGLFQPHTGLPEGTWEAGMFDYADLKQNYEPSYKRMWHAEAQVPWLYSDATSVMISYDDPESIWLKGAYAKEHGLGGAMLWELSGDDADSSLLNALNKGLAGAPLK